ncbi:putative phage abortive infection protein [Splendidivirga corallicola]|uniref:putative phage abortive infection protein n=1 Tax=Splendidivirga corallicola TaxID=3051826 RepID=UPI003D2AC4AF
MFSKKFVEIFYYYNAELGHYFDHLYHVLKYLNSIDEVENKKFYSSLFRSKISSYELLLLFYYSQSNVANKDFKKMLENLSFFKNLAEDDLLNPQHKRYYESKAFMD